MAVAVYSQDGYGPNGIRDVLPVAERWRIGGAPEGVTNYTRVMDYLWPEGRTPTQEEMLSNYPPQSGFTGDLSADEFPQVEMFRLQ
jgi:carbohydrate-binding DOMON domain-containing protein